MFSRFLCSHNSSATPVLPALCRAVCLPCTGDGRRKPFISLRFWADDRTTILPRRTCTTTTRRSSSLSSSSSSNTSAAARDLGLYNAPARPPVTERVYFWLFDLITRQNGRDFLVEKKYVPSRLERSRDLTFAYVCVYIYIITRRTIYKYNRSDASPLGRVMFSDGFPAVINNGPAANSAVIIFSVRKKRARAHVKHRRCPA